MMIRVCVQLVIGVTALLGLAVSSPATAAEREFYIVTVHHDGKAHLHGDATHKPEAYPDRPVASTRGMLTQAPSKDGEWSVRAFVFDPAEVTVQQGDDVRLHFVGVQGMSHTVVVEGVANPVVVKRGSQQVVSFRAEQAGIISFTCTDHPPSMRGQVVVLPKR